MSIQANMPPRSRHGRKRKHASPNDGAQPRCPCNCGATGLSARTTYYHLATRGLHVPDTEADHNDDVHVPLDLGGELGADDVQGLGVQNDSNPDARSSVASEFMSDMRRVVGVLSMGALVVLVMALQLRHHVARLSMRCANLWHVLLLLHCRCCVCERDLHACSTRNPSMCCSAVMNVLVELAILALRPVVPAAESS